MGHTIVLCPNIILKQCKTSETFEWVISKFLFSCGVCVGGGGG